MDKKNLPNPENWVMAKGKAVAKREKGHLSVEKLAKASNSSRHSRICAIQWNRVNDNKGK